MVEVQIAEMFGSDRNRSRDYQTSRGRRCRAKEANKTTRRSARSSVVENSLTEPTLLEMSGNACRTSAPNLQTSSESAARDLVGYTLSPNQTCNIHVLTL